MSKVSKIFFIIIISIMLICTIIPIANANDDTGDQGTTTQGTQSWITDITNMDTNAGTAGYGAEVSTAKTKVSNLMGRIVSVIRIASVGVAIVMLMAVAMKYLTSAPSDKAEIKKHAVVYVVGAVVLFGVSGIIGIIADFAGII